MNDRTRNAIEAAKITIYVEAAVVLAMLVMGFAILRP